MIPDCNWVEDRYWQGMKPRGRKALTRVLCIKPRANLDGATNERSLQI